MFIPCPLTAEHMSLWNVAGQSFKVIDIPLGGSSILSQQASLKEEN